MFTVDVETHENYALPEFDRRSICFDFLSVTQESCQLVYTPTTGPSTMTPLLKLSLPAIMTANLVLLPTTPTLAHKHKDT